MLGEERSIVTEISGTTRDAIHTDLKFEGRDILLVDTAGLRKRSRVSENVEFYSTLRTERALEEADIAVLLIDAVDGLTMQDIRVLKQAEEGGKGIVHGVNKWDALQEKDTLTTRNYERSIYDRLQTMDYVPTVFISAITKQRIYRLMQTVLEDEEQRGKPRVTTSGNGSLQQ